MVPDPAALRRRYDRGPLREADLDPDPVVSFRAWFADAAAGGVREPNAMVLATASAGGVPSARTVLLKGVDAAGFVFYTNLGSRKARDLAENPRASLVFPWHAVDRQVVVSGEVSEVGREQVAAYFATRPRPAQLGAWASAQSTPVPSRQVLDDRYAEVAARWPEGTPVPVPDFWGGFRVEPLAVEFWQGRPGRLHDRLRYQQLPDRTWTRHRLCP